jgi:hypothetical protein
LHFVAGAHHFHSEIEVYHWYHHEPHHGIHVSAEHLAEHLELNAHLSAMLIGRGHNPFADLMHTNGDHTAHMAAEEAKAIQHAIHHQLESGHNHDQGLHFVAGAHHFHSEIEVYHWYHHEHHHGADVGHESGNHGTGDKGHYGFLGHGWNSQAHPFWEYAFHHHSNEHPVSHVSHPSSLHSVMTEHIQHSHNSESHSLGSSHDIESHVIAQNLAHSAYGKKPIVQLVTTGASSGSDRSN